MRYALILLPLALSACADPVADARKEADIVQQTGGSNREICEAERRYAEALLKAHDRKLYREAKLIAEGYCLSADIDRGR